MRLVNDSPGSRFVLPCPLGPSLVRSHRGLAQQRAGLNTSVDCRSQPDCWTYCSSRLRKELTCCSIKPDRSWLSRSWFPCAARGKVIPVTVLTNFRAVQKDTCNVLMTFASDKARKQWLDVLQTATANPDTPTVFVSYAYKTTAGWHSTTYSGAMVEDQLLARDTPPSGIMLCLADYAISSCFGRRRVL